MSSHTSDGHIENPKKTAVDGGFGWWIVVAYGGANVSTFLSVKKI